MPSRSRMPAPRRDRSSCRCFLLTSGDVDHVIIEWPLFVFFESLFSECADFAPLITSPLLAPGLGLDGSVTTLLMGLLVCFLPSPELLLCFSEDLRCFWGDVMR